MDHENTKARKGVQPILDRLFSNVVGNTAALFERAAKSGRRWYRGQVACHEAFG